MIDDNDLKNIISNLLITSERYKGKLISNHLSYAEGLYLRFVNYCASIYYLLKGTESPVVPDNRFLDPGSINVLTRAALESFLVYYYVFIEPSDREEKNLRCDIWLRQGLQITIKFKPELKESQDKYLLAIQNDEILKDRIYNNPLFKAFPKEVKKSIKSARDWRIPAVKDKKLIRPSWSDIAISAGVPPDIARINYDFLSGYSHSGSLSVYQVHNAKNEDLKPTICDSSIALLKIIASRMIYLHDCLFKSE